MKIYRYHPDTGEYMGDDEAKLDPLETQAQGKAVYLISAYATIEEPPEAQEGYARCNINGAWGQIEDHRGITVYNKMNAIPRAISEMGAIPTEETELVPCDYPLWDGDKWIRDSSKEWESIRTTRNRLLDETDLKYCNADLWEAMTSDQKTAWRGYKAALRDIPQTFTNPSQVIWPAMPG